MFKRLIHIYCSFVILNSLCSSEISHSSFFYTFGGSDIGVGYRSHKENGFDVSISKEIVPDLINQLTVKGLYLSYPFINYGQNIYWGIGLSAVHYKDARIRPAKNHERLIKKIYHETNLSTDVILGYEFFIINDLQLFIQLGVGSDVYFGGCTIFPYTQLGFGF